MKNNLLKFLLVFCACFLISKNAQAQLGYQKDSIQIKIYTTLVIDKNLQVEDIFVRNVFCDFCNDDQDFLLQEEAKRRTFLLKDSPEYYRKAGEHKMALYIRMSKKDFNNLEVEK